ncbi:hypothetical protein CQW23_16171 [Capsicum baccatum]|uniref:Peptidase A1 domain-containing protein n=1 Tax=Capsicum baccatum TaxID=33114 RepID=A0A2G2WA83_CAPBA|nr:hypothetical protein CQW23_16171 [Capsicum baccatum]
MPPRMRLVVSGPSPTTPYDVDLHDDMFDEDDMLDMFLQGGQRWVLSPRQQRSGSDKTKKRHMEGNIVGMVSYIMEARKRFMFIDLTNLSDPPRPSYTFTLFSRNLFEKSKYKDYDSLLESKLSRSQARVSHLASIFGNGNSIGANGNLKSKSVNVKVPETTSTLYINGEYVASFTIGGEQIKSYLLIDIGSDLIWWQCKPCTEGGCYDQDDPIYNEGKSGTHEKLDCIAKSESCFTSNHIKCKQSTRACVYDVTYVDKSRTRGWIAEDVITFVLDQNQERILFGCGKDQTSGDVAEARDISNSV